MAQPVDFSSGYRDQRKEYAGDALRREVERLGFIRVDQAGGGGASGGEITNGDYTMLGGFVAGRTTGGSGPIELISVGKGLELASNGLRIAPGNVTTTELGTDITVTAKGILTQGSKAGMRTYLELNSYMPSGW